MCWRATTSFAKACRWTVGLVMLEMLSTSAHPSPIATVSLGRTYASFFLCRMPGDGYAHQLIPLHMLIRMSPPACIWQRRPSRWATNSPSAYHVRMCYHSLDTNTPLQSSRGRAHKEYPIMAPCRIHRRLHRDPDAEWHGRVFLRPISPHDGPGTLAYLASLLDCPPPRHIRWHLRSRPLWLGPLHPW